MALSDLFNGIADAIREKDGTADKILALTFPERIRGIPTGSGGGIQLSSISVASLPFKTVYAPGENFVPDGLVVTATYDNGASLEVDNANLSFSPAGALSEEDTLIVVSYTEEGITKTATIPIVVRLDRIYGVFWEGTPSSKWIRTDTAALFADPIPYVKDATVYGSPFDTIQPWAGMVVSERTGGTMVTIPKFYYRLYTEGKGLGIQISEHPIDDFHVSPAHMDRGDGKGERDVVYISRYLINQSYFSGSGDPPVTSKTLSVMATAIHNKGNGIYYWDYLIRFTIWLLYLVEMADWDSQGCIGFGTNASSGGTDTMPYHTGTMTSDRAAYSGKGTQYRNIEGLWDYRGTFLGGAYYNSDAKLCININPKNLTSTSVSDIVLSVKSGSPSAFAISEVGFPLFYPIEAEGSTTTYVCDDMISGKNQILNVGNRGGNSAPSRYGLFFNTIDATDYTNSYIGARSMELP